MNVIRYEDSFEKRLDPWGRDYYWLIGGPAENRGRPGNRSVGVGEGQGDDHAAGLQHDPSSGAGGNGTLAISFHPRGVGKRREPPKLPLPTVRTRRRKQKTVEHD